MRCRASHPDYGLECGVRYKLLMGPGVLRFAGARLTVVVVRLHGRKVCVPYRLFRKHKVNTRRSRSCSRHKRRGDSSR